MKGMCIPSHFYPPKKLSETLNNILLHPGHYYYLDLHTVPYGWFKGASHPPRTEGIARFQMQLLSLPLEIQLKAERRRSLCCWAEDILDVDMEQRVSSCLPWISGDGGASDKEGSRVVVINWQSVSGALWFTFRKQLLSFMSLSSHSGRSGCYLLLHLMISRVLQE